MSILNKSNLLIDWNNSSTGYNKQMKYYAFLMIPTRMSTKYVILLVLLREIIKALRKVKRPIPVFAILFRPINILAVIPVVPLRKLSAVLPRIITKDTGREQMGPIWNCPDPPSVLLSVGCRILSTGMCLSFEAISRSGKLQIIRKKNVGDVCSESFVVFYMYGMFLTELFHGMPLQAGISQRNGAVCKCAWECDYACGDLFIWLLTHCTYLESITANTLCEMLALSWVSAELGAEKVFPESAYVLS